MLNISQLLLYSLMIDHPCIGQYLDNNEIELRIIKQLF